jgi:hypothetical protein
MLAAPDLEHNNTSRTITYENDTSAARDEEDDLMTDSRSQQADLANLAAAIERAAGDLALGEEPSRFLVALEEAAGQEEGKR